jgi:hypothetical protein
VATELAHNAAGALRVGNAHDGVDARSRRERRVRVHVERDHAGGQSCF